MLTPTPFDLGLIIMGNSQVAFDAVCCSIIGVDPMTVDHIRLAAEHGFGTTDLAKIEITGDVTLDEAKARAKGFKVGLIRVEKYFEGTHISAYAGPPPEPEHGDYCWGGCPGAIEEAIEILRVFDKTTDERMPRMHVVFGAYDGEIPAKPGEKVVFIGDCADVEGRAPRQAGRDPERLQGSRDARSAHRDARGHLREARDRRRASSHGDVIRLEGCPVSVAEQVLALVTIGKLKNPYFDPKNMVHVRPRVLRLEGARRAQRAAAASATSRTAAFDERGEAAPELGGDS